MNINDPKLDKVHGYFWHKWGDDYNKADLPRIARFILKQCKIKYKGPPADALLTNWQTACRFIHNWQNND